MNNALDSLVGRVISGARRVHDYVQINFDDGSIINIFNPFSIAETASTSLDNLAGEHIVAITIDDSRIQISTERHSIIVSTEDKDYSGPEAMTYNPRDGSIVVF